jgi:hypothetical protein
MIEKKEFHHKVRLPYLHIASSHLLRENGERINRSIPQNFPVIPIKSSRWFYQSLITGRPNDAFGTRGKFLNMRIVQLRQVSRTLKTARPFRKIAGIVVKRKLLGV